MGQDKLEKKPNKRKEKRKGTKEEVIKQHNKVPFVQIRKKVYVWHSILAWQAGRQAGRQAGD